MGCRPAGGWDGREVGDLGRSGHAKSCRTGGLRGVVLPGSATGCCGTYRVPFRSPAHRARYMSLRGMVADTSLVADNAIRRG